jgi:hypothetical protein
MIQDFSRNLQPGATSVGQERLGKKSDLGNNRTQYITQMMLSEAGRKRLQVATTTASASLVGPVVAKEGPRESHSCSAHPLAQASIKSCGAEPQLRLPFLSALSIYTSG